MSSAASCPKYGGKVCRPEAGALCECYPGKKPSAAKAQGRERSRNELVERFAPVLHEVCHELVGAFWKFPSFNSPHEGWAVIREELDELWEHVKANEGHTAEAQQEALQIAAMACRYVLDLTNEEAL